MSLREQLRLYLVTDPVMSGPRGVRETVRQALEAGVGTVQLRDKEAVSGELAGLASDLALMCADHGALFLVNDRVDLALATGAGVHLGQDDLPAGEARRILGGRAVIGVSVRTPREAEEAEAAGADYLAANLVFPTDTKTDIRVPLGLPGLRMLRRASGLPLVAIGGIKAANAAEVLEAGADGIAVVSAIMAAPDVAAACRSLLDSIG